MIPDNKEARQLHVVYLGLDDFPFGLAETQKAKLVSKGLIRSGCKVRVISRWWNFMRWDQDTTAQSAGVVEGIEYWNASGALYRPESWWLRKILKIKGLLGEILELYRLRKAGRFSAAIVSTASSWRLLYYKGWSKLLRFPIFVFLGELRTAVPEPGFLKRMDARIFDNYALRFVDGLLPISAYLMAHVRKISPNTPLLKVPVLVDAHRLRDVRRDPECTYFLFCGDLGYMDIIKFIMHAFDRCNCRWDVCLYLVVNGSRRSFDELRREISLISKHDNVRVFSKLNDDSLYELYRNSCALLIPLRPTLKDIARFPHKIGEYCASGRPIVTTNYGEVSMYFENHKSAYIAATYDVEEYARAMDDVLSDPETADEVGRNGRLLAEREFDYNVHGPKMRQFIESVVGERNETLGVV